MIKTVIFDFDGVIAESVDVKTDAFRALFKDCPQHLDEILKFHIDNGGMSRYDKFRFIYKNMFKIPLSEKRFNRLCEKFSELVVEKVISAPFVKGARELINKCSGRYEMFVVSGTPDGEIKEIVQRRDLGKYFSAVFGSPATKTDLIKNVLKYPTCRPQEVVFIGDSINDLKAAKNTGVRFIARTESSNSKWAQGSESKFKNMKGVFEYIEKPS